MDRNEVQEILKLNVKDVDLLIFHLDENASREAIHEFAEFVNKFLKEQDLDIKGMVLPSRIKIAGVRNRGKWDWLLQSAVTVLGVGIVVWLVG